MSGLRRVVRIAGWSTLGFGYVWFAAVRNAGEIKTRKAARRAARRAAADLRS